jgi:hypothetical protein
MNDRWESYASALESGDSDRVNEVIDEIKDMDLDERVRLFEVCFEDLTEIYAESNDGYVRQSTVRVAEQLTPGIPLVFAATESGEEPAIEESDVREQIDTFCGFLLEAMTDTDGRVRQSAKRGLKDVFRTYESLEDTETIEALAVELEEMAMEYDDKRRDHLLEAKEDAEFSKQSGFSRILSGLEKEFGDSS